jgi:uncharacterized integral membrane protein (TIGR00698 family)
LSDNATAEKESAVATVVDARRPPVSATQTRAPLLESEDWLAVWVGFLTIGLVLAGVRPSLPAFGWTSGRELITTVIESGNLVRLLVVGAAVGTMAGAAMLLMNRSLKKFALGFPLLYLLAALAQVVAGNAAVSAWGLEYVIFAFVFGLLISNTIGVPVWLKDAASTEFYIKTGLVILGASILFGDLMQAGLLGIAQALLVVLAVWFVCFALARRLRVDDEFAAMLASAVSICGVSAAIAACGAIQGDRKKLSYVTSLVILVAAPMMVVMPQIVTAFGIPDLVGGAWLGGTLDTSASVVAAGEMISEPARNAGVVVKLSQNVLIGIAAFLLTLWWTMRDRARSSERPNAAVIWERFPKFVVGFVVASFVVSFLLDPSLVNQTKGALTALRTVWFALAFTSIGLETRFTELVSEGNGRPALAFLGGQAFNVVWTLLLAYLLFGGVLFAVPDLR